MCFLFALVSKCLLVCFVQQPKSDECSNKGHLQCGVCSCHSAFFGSKCQCSQDGNYTDERKECRNRYASEFAYAYSHTRCLLAVRLDPVLVLAICISTFLTRTASDRKISASPCNDQQCCARGKCVCGDCDCDPVFNKKELDEAAKFNTGASKYSPGIQVGNSYNAS